MKKLFIISLCLLCLCGCKEKTPNHKYESISKSEIETILEEELYVLWNKNKIDEVTNNERLTLGIKKYAKDNNLDYHDMESVKASDVENSFKKTSIGSLKLNHEDVQGSYKITTCEHTDWEYDANNSLYTSIPNGHGICAADKVYHKLESLEEKDGRYVATYKLMFSYSCEGDEGTLYKNYENAVNEEDSLGKISGEYSTEDEFKELMAKKYDEVKDKLATYTYTFEKENNKITLVDFNRK